MDLSFPPDHLVYSGIPDNSYLEDTYKLCLPGIDRLCAFMLQHGRDCLLYKLDLQRTYRQLQISSRSAPKDCHLLGFRHKLALFWHSLPFWIKNLCHDLSASDQGCHLFFHSVKHHSRCLSQWFLRSRFSWAGTFSLWQLKSFLSRSRFSIGTRERQSSINTYGFPWCWGGFRHVYTSHHLFLKFHSECLEFRLSRYYTLELT